MHLTYATECEWFIRCCCLAGSRAERLEMQVNLHLGTVIRALWIKTFKDRLDLEICKPLPTQSANHKSRK